MCTASGIVIGIAVVVIGVSLFVLIWCEKMQIVFIRRGTIDIYGSDVGAVCVVCARFARGSASLQRGDYITQEDMDKLQQELVE